MSYLTGAVEDPKLPNMSKLGKTRLARGRHWWTVADRGGQGWTGVDRGGQRQTGADMGRNPARKRKQCITF